jgi:hypothetical protein
MEEDEVTAKPPSVAVYRVLAVDCDDVAHDHELQYSLGFLVS